MWPMGTQTQQAETKDQEAFPDSLLDLAVPQTHVESSAHSALGTMTPRRVDMESRHHMQCFKHCLLVRCFLLVPNSIERASYSFGFSFYAPFTLNQRHSRESSTKRIIVSIIPEWGGGGNPTCELYKSCKNKTLLAFPSSSKNLTS